VILQCIQITAGICKQITLLLFCEVTSTFVLLLKFIYVSVQLVTNIPVLNACLKLINFIFQIFPVFDTEMSTSFTSYFPQTICIDLVWLL